MLIKNLKKLFISIFPIFFQKLRFYRKSYYWPSLKNPKTINEHIFLLKINSSESENIYTDKILAQKYIKSKVEEFGFSNLFLPEIIIESKNLDDLIERLPNEVCFIKLNHGSGMCFLYDPKIGISNSNKLTLNNWINLNYAFYSGEKCYEKIERKFFVERKLVTKGGFFPDDIKVHCYHGSPAVIQILRRSTGVLERQTFDENWFPQNWFQNEVLQVDLSSDIKRNVLEYSRKLSQPFKFVRVDFYVVDEKLYFSELTLYPASGSLPLKNKHVDILLGQKFANESYI